MAALHAISDDGLASRIKRLTATGHITPTDLGGAVPSTSNTLALRDANGNIQVNSCISNVATTVTSTNILTLTASSAGIQQFTGSVAQSVVFPVATTLTIGTVFEISNKSTQIITCYAQDGTTLLAQVYPSTTGKLTLTNAATANGTWNTPSAGGALQLLMSDSNGNYYTNPNTSWSNNQFTFSNSGNNAPITFNIGGFNQANNSANNNVSVLNLRGPTGELRGVTFQMNSGQSCQIISEYSSGGPVSSFAIWRGSTKMLTFYNATTVGCLTAFQAPNISVTSFMQPSITTFTAAGTVSTPISLCNSASAFSLALPTSPVAGQIHQITNVGTGIVTITGPSPSVMIGLNDYVCLAYTGSAWSIVESAFISNRASNFNSVAVASTVVNPFTIVTTAATQTLPAANSVPVGKVYTISNVSSGAVSVVVPGGTNATVSANTAASFTSNGTIWVPVCAPAAASGGGGGSSIVIDLAKTFTVSGTSYAGFVSFTFTPQATSHLFIVNGKLNQNITPFTFTLNTTTSTAGITFTKFDSTASGTMALSDWASTTTVKIGNLTVGLSTTVVLDATYPNVGTLTVTYTGTGYILC